MSIGPLEPRRDQASSVVDDGRLTPLDLCGVRPPFYSPSPRHPHCSLPASYLDDVEVEVDTPVPARRPSPGFARRPPTSVLDAAHALGDARYPWRMNPDFFAQAPSPGAPLMKDYDTFTDGTGAGSFDCSLPAPSSPQLGLAAELFPALGLDIASQLYAEDVEDAFDAIESWRDNVNSNYYGGFDADCELVDDGMESDYVDVDPDGVIDPQEIRYRGVKRPRSSTSLGGSERPPPGCKTLFQDVEVGDGDEDWDWDEGVARDGDGDWPLEDQVVVDLAPYDSEEAMHAPPFRIVER